MSMYTNVMDFRDTLQWVFNDDFELFKKMTNGKLNFIDNDTIITIERPSDLIPYYPYTVDGLVINGDIFAEVYLSSESYLSKLSYDFEHDNSWVFDKIKELEDLYKYYNSIPSGEQKII